MLKHILYITQIFIDKSPHKFFKGNFFWLNWDQRYHKSKTHYLQDVLIFIVKVHSTYRETAIVVQTIIIKSCPYPYYLLSVSSDKFTKVRARVLLT